MAKHSSSRGPGPQSIKIQRAPNGNAWVLLHPRAVREMAEDVDDVRAMIEAGETDVAIDELRWLLDHCHDMIEVHFLLGKLAVEVDHDLALARGHFGTGYQLGLQALRRAKLPTPVPALHPANRMFFDCGRGLAWCLRELGKSDLALEVVEQLLALDPADPLGLTSWLDEIRVAGKPLIGLEQLWRGE